MAWWIPLATAAIGAISAREQARGVAKAQDRAIAEAEAHNARETRFSPWLNPNYTQVPTRQYVPGNEAMLTGAMLGGLQGYGMKQTMDMNAAMQERVAAQTAKDQAQTQYMNKLMQTPSERNPWLGLGMQPQGMDSVGMFNVPQNPWLGLGAGF